MNTCTPSVLHTKTYSYHRTVLRQLTETEPAYYLQLARFQEELSPSCLQSNKKSQYSSTYTRALCHIMLELTLKVITMAKQRNKNEGISWSQWELKVKLPKAREKVNDKVTVGVIFTPDWLRG